MAQISVCVFLTNWLEIFLLVLGWLLRIPYIYTVYLVDLLACLTKDQHFSIDICAKITNFKVWIPEGSKPQIPNKFSNPTRLTHENDPRVWLTRMTHEFGSREWSMSLTHEIDPRVWATRMIHEFDPREWPTSLTHETDPRVWRTRMTHKTHVTHAI